MARIDMIGVAMSWLAITDSTHCVDADHVSITVTSHNDVKHYFRSAGVTWRRDSTGCLDGGAVCRSRDGGLIQLE